MTVSERRSITDRIGTIFFGKSRLNVVDFIFVLLLLAIALLNGWRSYDFSGVLYEDSAILMRYSENLAHTNQIVWNVGEKPVDGATDFLFMVALAGGIKLGLSVETSALILAGAAHLLTIALVYIATRELWKLNRAVALVAAGFLVIGPGFVHVAAYSGTTVFAFFGVLTWYFGLRYALVNQSNSNAIWFAVSGLLAGLTRPEGVFLAGFMALAVLFYLGLRKSIRLLAASVIIFGVFGGAYFLWRWAYFGYPLPNPFYKKGQGSLHFGALAGSVLYILLETFPFSLLFLFGLATKNLARKTIFLAIPIVGFTLIWVLMSTEGNFNNRFQYPILPIFALTCPALIEGIWNDWRPALLENRRRWLIAAATLLSVFIVYRFSGAGGSHVYIAGEGDGQIGLHDLGVLLSKYAEKGYTVASSEAGLLPLYSGWKALDTWGLNDQWIAHNGTITADYLDQWKPDVILFRAYFSPVTISWGEPDAIGLLPDAVGWNVMTDTLRKYAEDHHYILAADYGVAPNVTHYIYVKPDFPDSQEIVSEIRSEDYEWSANNRSVNYAEFNTN